MRAFPPRANPTSCSTAAGRGGKPYAAIVRSASDFSFLSFAAAALERFMISKVSWKVSRI